MLDTLKIRPFATLLLATALTACGEKGMTYGDANSVIAVTDAERWGEISQTVIDTLEQTIQTVRDEKAFTVTYQEPYAQYWNNLRRFRQMLLIGTQSDPWITEALDESSTDVDIEGPGVYQAKNAWARDQTITFVILPDDGSLDPLPRLLAEVSTMLDRQFRNYAASRMYMSGVNEALSDTLAAEVGFRILVPDVYRWQRQDSVVIFRNDQPDPSELIRQVMVTWRTPAPSSLSTEEIIAWRQSVADGLYNEPQELVEEGMSVEPVTLNGHEGMEIRTQWRNPPDRGWPAGGLVLMRTLTCDAQDRMYLIDAWLYAPGREKYEYLVQLETILGTFDCEV
ncbi:MAG: DUF4837 family protein [Gemmatimonadota bacterium]